MQNVPKKRVLYAVWDAIVIHKHMGYNEFCKFSQFASNPVYIASDREMKVKRSSFMRSRGL